MSGSDVKRPTADPAPSEHLDDFDLPDLDQLFAEEEPDTGVEAPPPPKKASAPAPKKPSAPKKAAPEPAAPTDDLPDLPDFVINEEAPAAAPAPPEPADAIAEDPASGDFLSSQASFRRESQELARAREWQRLAGTISAALDAAPWAAPPEVKAALLFDLARVHRDRLQDLSSAESAFRRLVEIDPAHVEGLEFLSRRYEQNADWQSLYLLTTGAIEATWDPTARLAWTRRAVAIADERLRSSDLALEAWERLWKLGDFPDEAAAALSEGYRQGARWDRLAAFLKERAGQLEGSARLIALREVAEAYLSALRDQGHAAEVLEAVLAERPNDAVALLGMARVYARKRDWDALNKLGAGPVRPPSALLDVQRLCVDALWSGDELDRGAQVLDRILAAEPRDSEALRLKEEYLSRSGKTDELVAFLSARADEARDDAERAALLARAATLAERELDAPRKAAELLERRAAIPSVRLEALRDLARLHETTDDQEGLRRALEGELALTRNPQSRVEVLRRLAEHCAHKLGDDARAESCWRDLLAAVPDDPAVRDELVALYRRRGDFVGVDRTLVASAWRPLDDVGLIEIWRAAARNAQDNLGDRALAVRAWRRVSDLSPDDAEALRAMVSHRQALSVDASSAHDLVDVIERTVRLVDAGERLPLTLDIARLSETVGDRAAALATYERILVWDPQHAEALAALARLRPNGVTRGALDAALMASVGDRSRRAALLQELLALVPANDPLARLFTLRRLLLVIGPTDEVIAQLAKAAAESKAWEELAVIYEDLAARAANEAERGGWCRRVAKLYEEELRDPLRALLTLQAARQPTAAGLDEIADLLRLAEATSRPEDALALLELATRAQVPATVRRDALRRKVSLCERLGSPNRAFWECARLLQSDPQDADALATARRLAASAGLWRHLDALYGELRDRASEPARRLELTIERQRIRKEQLKDPAAALDEQLLAYRLDPGAGEELVRTAGELAAWDDVLPVLERGLASAPVPSADELARLAKLHHAQRKDPRRAFDLYRLAFELQPLAETGNLLQELAQATEQWAALADTLRTAAARAGSSPQALDLYRTAAALYTERVRRPELALDVHQRILQLQPTDLRSLLVVIDHQRQAGLWRELRDSLQRWLDLAGASDAKKTSEVLVEIARLSQAQLADPETALATYARVLSTDPKNQEALDGIRSLTEGPLEPALQLRRLRVELAQASGEDRARLLLQCAELQERELDDSQSALQTLSTLVAETGPNGPGAGPLIALLERLSSWPEVVEAMIARASAMEDRAARTRTLRDALAIADEHGLPANSREQLCRRILADDPGDRATMNRLLALLRMGGRFVEQAAFLDELLAKERERELEDELARLRVNALDQLDGAQHLVESWLEPSGEDDDALAWLATISQRRRGDLQPYLTVREQLARRARPSLGALILCHLAEVKDELGADPARAIELYREARVLDPGCAPAMEALKALGRRTRNWREAASLLPGEDSRKLGWSERAASLRARGDAARESDPAAALSWYERAVAVDADDHLAWDALGDMHAASGDAQTAIEARRASLAAYERATKPDPTRLEEHARRIQALAEAEAAAGKHEAAIGLSRRAFALVPSLPPSALAVARQHEEDGESAPALAIYDRLLAHPDSLSNDQRLAARYGRGRLAALADRLDSAIDDLRDGLRLQPLHSGLLQALADVLLRKGRSAAAVQHYTTALLLAHDAPSRAALYARIGRLCEERLDDPEEAGVCYDLAIVHGSDDADVMARALGHYRRSGEGERALAVIERLLPVTTDARTLAMLWAERGRIYSDTEGDKAIEAFDLALSYDPSCQPAVSGLAALLEQRGDWKQLVDLLEVRAESGSPEARADALRALARISREHLKDAARTERLLLEAARLAPRKEDYDELLALYGKDPARANDRREVIAAQLMLVGPWMSRLIEMGRELFADGRRRWAWCVLSPLMNATMPDAATKTLVLELRKEFEKGDNVEALSPEAADALFNADLEPRIRQVLVELDGLLSLGPTTAEAAGIQGAAKLDARTAIGKTFAGLAERLGMPEAILYRAADLETPFVLLDGEPAQIFVKADLLPLLAPSEITFWLTWLLASSRPGSRLLEAASPKDAHDLVAALWSVTGLSDEPAPPEMAERLRALPAERLKSWRERLRGMAPLGPERIRQAVRETSLRVALLTMPELRVALKLLGRVDDEMPKLTSTGKIEDVDEIFAGSSSARALAGFSLLGLFGDRL